MTILTFTSEKKANDALTEINNTYKVPISKGNGYKMTKWADVQKAVDDDIWFFEKPERTVDKITKSKAMENVIDHTEVSKTDPSWFPPEE